MDPIHFKVKNNYVLRTQNINESNYDSGETKKFSKKLSESTESLPVFLTTPSSESRVFGLYKAVL